VLPVKNSDIGQDIVITSQSLDQIRVLGLWIYVMHINYGT